jgi:hypothetical protein
MAVVVIVVIVRIMVEHHDSGRVAEFLRVKHTSAARKMYRRRGKGTSGWPGVGKWSVDWQW